MRVLIAGLPQSPHAIRHANLLVEAGIEVGFASVLPKHPDADLDGRVTVFPHPYAPVVPRGGPFGAIDRARGVIRQASTRTQLATVRLAPRSLQAGAWFPGSGNDRADWHRYTNGAIDSGLRDAIASLGVYKDGVSAWLAYTIDEWRPDIVVSTGLEQAGFVTLAARARCHRPFPRWLPISLGLDLQFAVQFPLHRRWIKAVLRSADALFLECHRDVPVARRLGFTRDLIEVQPIGGGWDVDMIRTLRQPGPTSTRTTIAVKGYAGAIGRGLVAIEGVRRASDALLAAGMDVALFAAHPDVALAANLLAADTGLRVAVWPRLPYTQLLERLGTCRAIVGMSASDAIATTALEAMLVGAFPIQSNSSCLNEWITCGRSGLLTPADDPEPLAAAIRRVVNDPAFVDAAVAENDREALPRLQAAQVNPKIVTLYQRLSES
ncbi:MAG: glycosyltransferase [Thermomicrobiales bacterium]